MDLLVAPTLSVFPSVNRTPIVSLVDAAYLTSGCSYLSTVPPENEVNNEHSLGRKSTKGQTVKFRQERKLKNLRIDISDAAILPHCPSKCSSKTSKEDRQLIWDDFREITSIDQRWRYIAQLIKTSTPKLYVVSEADRKLKRDKTIKYYLKSSSDQQTGKFLLCKKCFMTFFRVTPSKIRTIVTKKLNNGQSVNIHHQRGKKAPGNKILENDIEEASLFLLSVPAYESHYGRADSSKKYLPDYHTKSSLFEDFKATYANNRVHYNKSCKIFKDLKLSIKSKACDTCKTCDELHVRVESAPTEEIKKQIRIEQECHWQKWKSAVAEKKSDAMLSITNPSVKVIAYDLEQIL